MGRNSSEQQRREREGRTLKPSVCRILPYCFLEIIHDFLKAEEDVGKLNNIGYLCPVVLARIPGTALREHSVSQVLIKRCTFFSHRTQLHGRLDTGSHEA